MCVALIKHQNMNCSSPENSFRHNHNERDREHWSHLFGACDALCVLESCFICLHCELSVFFYVFMCRLAFRIASSFLFLGCVNTLIVVNIWYSSAMHRNGRPLLNCLWCDLYRSNFICGALLC